MKHPIAAYLRRFALRPMLWLVRVTSVFACIALLSLLLDYVTMTSIAVCVAIYAIWEIGRSIRSIQPLNVNIARGENLIVEAGASVSIPAVEMERVITIISGLEANKRAEMRL